MTTLREAIEQRDEDAFIAAIEPDAVWIGVHPGQLCRNGSEVAEMVHRGLASRVANPEVLFETEDVLVVDPHLDPPAEIVPEVHQVFVLSDGRITEIRDYPNRASALAAVQR